MKPVESLKRPVYFSQTKSEHSLRDAGEITQFLSRRFAPVTIEPFRKNRNISFKTVSGLFPNIKTARSEFQHGINLRPKHQYDGVFFMAPLAGFIENDDARGSVTITKGAAVASDGATCRLLQFSTRYVQCGVTIDRTFFAERLEVLLERPFAPDILFDPVLDARSGPYAAVVALMTCVTGAEFGEALARSQHTAARMPATIADFMIENWRHSYSHHLDRVPPLIAPRHVKLALNLIDDHPEMIPSVDEIARICGVSLRALQYGFRHFVGTSITEHQRRVRLERARRDLAVTADSIDAVALRWGFSNGGRFSRYFKARYGIYPSEIRKG